MQAFQMVTLLFFYNIDGILKLSYVYTLVVSQLITQPAIVISKFPSLIKCIKCV